MSKKSIRFFNDREVRAVWDEEYSRWWFSATDIVLLNNRANAFLDCFTYSDNSVARRTISHFNEHAFEMLVMELFQQQGLSIQFFLQGKFLCEK